MLVDTQIAYLNQSGGLGIEPYDPEMLQPTSYDVTLSPQVVSMIHCGAVSPETGDYRLVVDPAKRPTGQVHTMDGPYLMEPGEFLLASTDQVITLGPTVAARVEGKSSIGRLGLAIHVTAGFIDPGFSGQVTLELVNLSRFPFRLHPHMKIGQVCFFDLDRDPDVLYGTEEAGSRYANQRGPTLSRSYRGFRTFPPAEAD